MVSVADGVPRAAPTALTASLRSAARRRCTDGSLAPFAHASRLRSHSGPDGGGQVHGPDLADLHLVPAGQRRRVDALAVDIGAVERTHVVHRVTTSFAAELRMPAGHGYIVEEDVAVRVATRRSDVLIQQEPAAGVRAAFDDQERRARRQ